MVSEGPEKKNLFTESKVQQAGLNDILKLMNDSKKISEWKKQLFPLDYVLLSHNPSNSETQEKLEAEWEKLKKRAEDILI